MVYGLFFCYLYASMSQLDLFAQIEQEITQQNQQVITPMVADKLYHSITQVAAMFNVNASLLRFWEKEFPQIKLRKNGKGDRLFTKEDIELIGSIYYLTKQRKFTLEGSREYLKKDKKTVHNETELVQSLLQVKQFLLDIKKSLSAS
jgi:DNA-binding transcriptional MerR regulator